MKVKYNNKIINVKDLKNCNKLERFLGLMFKNKKKARALLFQFKKPSNINIHSCFVFFHFVAIYLDDKNKILEYKKIKPFTFIVKPKKFYSKLIEIPINKEYHSVVKLLVGD